MEVIKIDLARERAAELRRDYLRNVHYSKPIDQMIRRAYRVIEQGGTIIRAIASVPAAGVKGDLLQLGLPKLALCNAAAEFCRYTPSSDGSAEMSIGGRWANPRDQTNVFRWPRAAFPRLQHAQYAYEAQVPIIPKSLRPSRAVERYHILWEAEWDRTVPRDPLLIERINNKVDMWIVHAAWDLTEVERVALDTMRVH
jgi:hypothetical protein